jgi:phosphate starvation-inducible PhoH-like protein
MKNTEKTGKKRFATHQKTETSRIIKAVPKNDGQKKALKTIDENVVTIVSGVPGTGKTHCAVAYALQMLFREKYSKIIFTRPVVEAGEHLGFLPGDFDEKLAPYLIPIMDILGSYLSTMDIMALFDEGKLMSLPLAYMRGVTFQNCVVILDEAQNVTPKQMLMFLTRVGENCKVIVAGDISQSDIFCESGLKVAIRTLEGTPNLAFVELDESCIVRDPIVAEINRRFGKEPVKNEGDAP